QRRAVGLDQMIRERQAKQACRAARRRSDRDDRAAVFDELLQRGDPLRVDLALSLRVLLGDRLKRPLTIVALRRLAGAATAAAPARPPPAPPGPRPPRGARGSCAGGARRRSTHVTSGRDARDVACPTAATTAASAASAAGTDRFTIKDEHVVVGAQVAGVDH